MADIQKTEITKAQARKLTDRIKSAADELWSLLLEAHEGKAWKSLGYTTWDAYIAAEFDMGRSQSYRLLDQARVTKAIEAAAGVPHGGQITERVARDIKPVIEEVTQEIRAKVQAGVEPVQATYEVIEAKRVERKAEPVAAKPASAPEPANDDHDDGPDLAELVDELQAENTRLAALIKASEADDLKAEAIKWRRCHDNAQRQQSEAMDRVRAAEKREAWNKKQLMRCGKAVGEEDPTKIAAAVEAMARARAAA